jgi:hypothetical protein
MRARRVVRVMVVETGDMGQDQAVFQAVDRRGHLTRATPLSWRWIAAEGGHQMANNVVRMGHESFSWWSVAGSDMTWKANNRWRIPALAAAMRIRTWTIGDPYDRAILPGVEKRALNSGAMSSQSRRSRLPL